MHSPLIRCGESSLASPVDDDGGECDGLAASLVGGGGGGETNPAASTKTETERAATVQFCHSFVAMHAAICICSLGRHLKA